MAKVSVIVPVYNVDKYISRCLDSLVNQTLNDIEIIIVNDGSTDNSKHIALEYLKKYPTKIKFFEKENGGLSSARNFGMKYATGEYIAFIDSDDYVEPEMYEEMYKLAKKEDADMVECDFLWEWEKESLKECRNRNRILNNNISGDINKELAKYKEQRIIKDKRRNYKNKREMMKKPRVVAWNKLIKRNIIEQSNAKFPDGLIYEDLEFFFKIIPYINKISYINKYFVHYMQRKNSISNTQTEKNSDIFKILNNIEKFYIEKSWYEQYKSELKQMKIRILLGSSLKRILKIEDKKLKRRLLLETVKNITVKNITVKDITLKDITVKKY